MRANQPFEPVPNEGVEEYAPGESAASWRPGDLVLTHGSAWTSRLIRFGQRLRIHGDDRKYTHWNHVAVVVADDGSLVKVLGAHVTRTHVSKYEPREYRVLRIDTSAADRAQAVRFCLYAAGEVYANGVPRGERIRYGSVTIVSVAFTLLTGARFSFQLDGTDVATDRLERRDRCDGQREGEPVVGGGVPERAPWSLAEVDVVDVDAAEVAVVQAGQRRLHVVRRGSGRGRDAGVDAVGADRDARCRRDAVDAHAGDGVAIPDQLVHRRAETQVDNADSRGDGERSAKAHAERDAIVDELTRIYGLGGTIRRSPDHVERARKAVTRRIRDTLTRIERAHPTLGRHLHASVHTGVFCSYQPERDVAWIVEPT